LIRSYLQEAYGIPHLFSRCERERPSPRKIESTTADRAVKLAIASNACRLARVLLQY
jgi:hypothetical protein